MSGRGKHTVARVSACGLAGAWMVRVSNSQRMGILEVEATYRLFGVPVSIDPDNGLSSWRIECGSEV